MREGLIVEVSELDSLGWRVYAGAPLSISSVSREGKKLFPFGKPGLGLGVEG